MRHHRPPPQQNNTHPRTHSLLQNDDSDVVATSSAELPGTRHQGCGSMRCVVTCGSYCIYRKPEELAAELARIRRQHSLTDRNTVLTNQPTTWRTTADQITNSCSWPQSPGIWRKKTWPPLDCLHLSEVSSTNRFNCTPSWQMD